MNLARRAVRATAVALMAVGLLALGYAAYVIVDARVFQATAQRRFERQGQTPGAAPAAVEGGVVGEVRIARLGLMAVVVQGDSAAVLQRAVGHLAGTAWPGQPGNVVLAGHRDTFFRPLARVRVGDVIAVRTSDGAFEYLVESTAVVPPSRVQVLEPTPGRMLTLVTCYPFGYLGSAPDRFIVRARETARPVPPSSPQAAPRQPPR